MLCRLVESLQVKEETAQYVDIESLAHRLCCGISTRQVTNNFMFFLLGVKHLLRPFPARHAINYSFTVL